MVKKNGDVNVDVLYKCNQQVVEVISSINEALWILFVYASMDYRSWRVLWEEASTWWTKGFLSL